MKIDHILESKGQSFIEYALILSIAVLALTTMQVYVKRGIQAGIKIAADELGPQEVEETDPDKGQRLTFNIDTQTQDAQKVGLFEGGRQRIDIINNTSSSSGETTYESTTQK